MNIGMLWFDNDQKTDLIAKIKRAADYYEKKYGVRPDVCFVHPSMVNEDTIQRNGIVIKTNRRILPNHFWLGVQDQSVKSLSSLSG
ncbi:MAG: hypothetical protein N2646_04250 [Bellilinea sp.]|jgi:hypothetical protein|nr:hypothetical protein [Bellilinea sp.]